MADNAIYSAQMLWRDFDSSLPLKEDVITEEVFDGVTYRDVYFSGREIVGGERVRIFGVYAFGKMSGRKQSKNAILILPDMSETINHELIDLYVNQGYAVLMVDYRGKFDESEEYTKYPASVEYANFLKSGRNLNFADNNAKQTSWYEWVAVAKYAVSFLLSQPEIDKVGVLGFKNGSNVAWMLCGTDDRVTCFASAFGAGWRAYKGCFKNSLKDDIAMNEERIRFLAGVEVQAYAQNVKCPLLFVAPTNSADFDVDRSCETLVRVPEIVDEKSKKPLPVERFVCFAPRFSDVIDAACAKDIELFFARYLGNSKTVFPFEPKINLSIEDKKLVFDVEIDFSEIKKPKSVKLFVSEGIENPACRDWLEAQEIKVKSEKKRGFIYKMNGNATFVTYFVLAEYRGGFTICSKIVSKKIDEFWSCEKKLIYSSKEGVSSFSVEGVDKNAIGGLIFNDADCVSFAEGANNISGVTSKYGLISYRVNKVFTKIHERSMIMFDICCRNYSLVTISLVSMNGDVRTDFMTTVEVSGAEIWQNILIKCTDFKSSIGVPIRDFSNICAIKFSYDEQIIINNLLII